MSIGWMLAGVLSSVVVAAAETPPTLDGRWTGTVAMHDRASVPLGASLAVVDGRVHGTLTMTVSGVTSTFDVTGKRNGRRLRLTGELLPQHVRWIARWSASRGAWRGPLLVRGGGRMRGMASLQRDAGDPATGCGFDAFASTLLPQVFVPVCGQCHVASGAAARTRLRVTPDDAATTARSALALVDAGAPEQSLLLRKPRNDVAHGGGQQIAAGSAHEQMLLDWIRAVTAPSCGGGGGTGDPYLDNCASCHGDDGRGLDGRPDIRCNRDVRPVLRSGRIGPAGEMPAFPQLGAADVAAIQARLRASCPDGSATGEALFAGNCGSCHGDGAVGSTTAPSIRCATRVANAIRVGRGRDMPAMSALTDLDVSLIAAYLDDTCTSVGRPGEDLWAGNCAGCHGATARGGRNGLGVSGPDVRCTGGNDFVEKIAEGDEAMPSFPKLHAGDVDAIVGWVHGTYCAGGGESDATAAR